MTAVRFVPYALAALVAIGGVVVLSDALVVTDEEELEGFVTMVTGDGVDGALSYADPSRVPVELVSPEGSYTFADGAEVDLADHAHSALAALDGGSAELVSKAIEIDGDRALVALRLSHRDEVVDAQFRFVRRGDGWRLARVRVL